MNDKSITLDELASNLQDNILDVADGNTPLLVHIEKTPVAAIISLELYDALNEVIHELSVESDEPALDIAEWSLYKLLHPQK